MRIRRVAVSLSCLLSCLALLVCAGWSEPNAPPEGMVLVPAGPFTMGTDHEGGILSEGDAGPAHEVRLPGFYIDKTEVTNAQYQQYCDATGYAPPPYWKNGKYAAGAGNQPVRFVNWWEAQAYAAWKGKRLPTEAEWEKAARGTDARNYPWGNEWDPSLLVWDVAAPQAAGSKPAGASPYGVLDMAGNVWEWVADWYQPYPDSPAPATAGFGTTLKVIRGGCYLGFPGREYDCSTYHRTVARPQTRSEMVGFRCAKSMPK